MLEALWGALAGIVFAVVYIVLDLRLKSRRVLTEKLKAQLPESRKETLLEKADREANEILFKEDPALAVELGYEPPKAKPKATPEQEAEWRGYKQMEQGLLGSQLQRNQDFAAMDAQMRQMDQVFRQMDQLFNQAALDPRQLQQMQGMPHPGYGKCNCLLSAMQPGCDCTCGKQRKDRLTGY